MSESSYFWLQRFLYKNNHIAYLGTVASSVILIFALWGRIDSSILYAWFAVNLLIIVVRIGLELAYANRRLDPEVKKKRRFLFLLGIMASGLWWAVATWLLFPDEDIAGQMFLIFVLMGMTAATPALSAPSTIAFLCFAQPILIALTIRFMLEGGRIYITMALLTQIYNLALIMTSMNFARADRRLRMAKDEAEEATLVKSEFIANISHEIRTPMNAIMGINHLLKQTKLSPKQDNYIDKSMTASRSLLSVISNILDYAKAEGYHARLNNSSFDLNKVIETVKTLIDLHAAKRGLHFHCNIPTDIPTRLIGDSVKLQQVLSNLAENAVKFTDKGHIQLNIDKIEQKDTLVRLRFSVADTGIGIHDKDLHRLFTSFSQVNTSYSRQYGGTGLGLAISQELVKLMGGIIKVESKFGHGSEFFFTLPFEPSDETTEAESLPFSQTGSIVPVIHDVTVLLIEDDELNRLVAYDLLVSLGADVHIASSAKQAFLYLAQELPDLVFLDIQMPKKDGYDTISQIRKDERLKDLTVICMTAHASNEENEKALASGMDDYLTKPIDPFVLANTLQKWLPDRTIGSSALKPPGFASKTTSLTGNRQQSEIEIQHNLEDLCIMLSSREAQFNFISKSIASLTISSAQLRDFLSL